MSEKIQPQHLARKAILYVRQSSPYQVLNNRESQKLQYAMEAHLRTLGWQQVEVIDEDLGRSAGGSVTRTGFERMIAQVCLGEVGAVCARKSPVLPATAASGSNWLRSAAWSIHCSSTKKPSTRQVVSSILCKRNFLCLSFPFTKLSVGSALPTEERSG